MIGQIGICHQCMAMIGGDSNRPKDNKWPNIQSFPCSAMP